MSAAAEVRSMNKVKLVVLAVLIILAAIVILQNTKPVETYVLFATIEMPQTLLLLVTFLLGGVGGLIFAAWWGRRGKKKS